MLSPARQAAYAVLGRIESRQGFSDRVLQSRLTQILSERDRRLVTEIVYGSLRWQGLLDHILAGASQIAWPEVDSTVRNILRLSLYQIRFMDRVPAHAVVFDSVELAKREAPKAAGYVNGILRKLLRLRPWDHQDFERRCAPWALVSLPEWLWGRWARRFGDDTARRFALSLNRPPRATYRFNGNPRNLPISLTPSNLVPGAAFSTDGEKIAREITEIEIQDEASQLIPCLFGDISGKTIWDVCAAPGGKSEIMARRCGSAGAVYATDIHEQRLKEMRRIQFSGGGVRLVVADASGPPPFTKSFDCVLADVPCSGLGTLRRNPEIKWRVQPEKLETLAKLQSLILQTAAGAVRPGGILVYSTCSTEPEENEEVVDRFLARNHAFSLAPPDAPSGVELWLDERGYLKTFPSDRLWDGFFAARIVRKG